VWARSGARRLRDVEAVWWTRETAVKFRTIDDADLSGDERQDILWRTAARVFRLEV
jgi:hypothetical protein